MKILTIVGNRPQFIKLGVTSRRLRELGPNAPFQSVVVNTGQHYDEMLSDVFFSELQIEPPHYNLEIGSGHIVDQIGKMMAPLRDIVERERPDGILVYGDTNSTAAGALVASHLDIPLIHVEGGERLYRRSEMPEEVNRVLTDHLADLCLASSRKAVRYLMREGFGSDRVIFVGDPMYDIFKLTGELLKSRRAAQPSDFGMRPDEFVLATIHRSENTDDPNICLPILTALDSSTRPVLLPVHPRLKARLGAWDWTPQRNLHVIEPLGYFDFQSLLRQSAAIVTDSGGVGREAFFAAKGCVVPLESSAWIEAVEAGLAIMAGQDPSSILEALESQAPGDDRTGLIEANFGAGNAGARIVDEIALRIHPGFRVEEGPWHPVASFARLPRATCSNELTTDAFTEIVRRNAAAGAAAKGIIIDIRQSFEGAGRLASIARHCSIRLEVLVSLSEAGYNPFQKDALEMVRNLVADGHLLVAAHDEGRGLFDQSALAIMLFGTKLRPISLAGLTVDMDLISGAASLRNWDPRETPLIVTPAFWHENPVFPFESALRLVDGVREAGLDALRQSLGACRT